MRAREAPFATEAALCAAFIAALPVDWTPFAETAGWDILLVRRADGCQIGVEAKLKLNALVLAQTVEESGFTRSEGPDYRAVLVPQASAVTGVPRLAELIGITVIGMEGKPTIGRLGRRKADFWPPLPNSSERHFRDQWHEWLPMRRHSLPEFVPDVAAGAPAPLQLTDWKIAALKIVAILETRGAVTREDFKTVGIDHRRWTARWPGWLLASSEGWRASKALPDFKGQHPKVFAELVATAEKWMPAYVAPAPRQEAML